MFIGAKAHTFSADRICGYGPTDGLARNEISDAPLQFKRPLEEILATGQRKYLLGEMIHHPELFAAYPGLRRTPVRVISHPDTEVSNTYFASCGRILMELNPSCTADEVKNHLMHEVQHNVQHIEGFTGGASQPSLTFAAYCHISDRLSKRRQHAPNQALDDKSSELREAVKLIETARIYRAKGRVMVAVEQLLRRGDRAYRKVSGEVEAYATGDRVSMTIEERQQRPNTHLLAQPCPAPATIRESMPFYQRREKIAQFQERICSLFNSLIGHDRMTPKSNHSVGYKNIPAP